MNRISFLALTLLWVSLASFGPVHSKDYIIFNVAQDIPMGEPDEVIKKNFYVNMGEKQGLKQGSELDVFRIISRLDPYQTKKRFSYRVKIGELKVIHSEDNTAICDLSKLGDNIKSPMFEINNFMIGDLVGVKLKD